MIYGESFIFEPILDLCHQCVDGHAQFEEEEEVDRKIYRCEVNERFVMRNDVLMIVLIVSFQNIC